MHPAFMTDGHHLITVLPQVKNLNLWGCELDNVELLSSITNVEILSLSVNRIASLKDFASCSKLKELYLRKNEIQDLKELVHLAKLKDLNVLWLSENGVADHKLYRNICIRLLPSLVKLDSVEVSPAERAAAMKDPETERELQALLEKSKRPPSAASAPPLARQATPPRPPVTAPPSAPAAKGGSAIPSGRRKNILYAVMALVGELDLDDLVYVKREIEQRLGSEQPLV